MVDLRSIVAQLAPSFDINRFLAEYVRGTQELDYSRYLGYAGLNLETQQADLPQAGFSASRNRAGLLQVDTVDAGSDAQRAGLRSGDLLSMVDGKALSASTNPTLPSWRPGQTVALQVTRDGVAHTLQFRIGVHQQISMEIKEDPRAAPDRLRVREGWLEGITNPTPGQP